jgi:hypothetical protein
MLVEHNSTISQAALNRRVAWFRTAVAAGFVGVVTCVTIPSAHAQFKGGDIRGGAVSYVGPRAPMSSLPSGIGGVGQVDQGIRNGPGDNGTTLSSASGQSPRKVRRSGNSVLNNSGPNGVPPANERRYVPDEVVILLNGNPTAAIVDAIARRHRLVRVESQRFELMGATLYRWHIPNGRSVRSVTTELSADRGIGFAQPNYVYALQQATAGAAVDKSQDEADSSQYALAKLHLPEAHGLAKGDKVLVAVIDSGIDTTHPEIQDVVAGQFDALGSTEGPHPHGTAVAGIIAAHGRLIGAAPSVHILAVRAFGASASGTEGTTFNILKGLDWATGQGARIVNMSFAGPTDPLLGRSMANARQKGAILVAAAGNAGPKSPPLYPAADPNVIAVTATDANDQIFAEANRGSYIAVSAPGVDILVAAPGDGYQVSSGTSFAAAYVSGVIALILERRPKLLPDAARRIVLATAKDLGPKGRDDEFGAGLVDAYQAILSLEPKPVTAVSTDPSVH